MATLAFIHSELFPLDCFRCNFVSALQLEYYRDASHLCRTSLDNVSRIRNTTLAFILPELVTRISPSDAISGLLCNLNILWYIIMTLYNSVEQVMTMCRIQE